MAEPRAYLMRMRFRGPDEAQALGRELESRGADVELHGAEITTVWPASDADDVTRWPQRDFPELLFFLRSWAGIDPERAFEVVEEGPLAAAR